MAEAPILGDMHEEVGIDSRVVRTESESPTAVLVKCRLGYAGELRDYRARIEQAISMTTLVARFLHRTFRDVAMGLLVACEPQFVRERSGNARNVGIEFAAVVYWEGASRKPYDEGVVDRNRSYLFIAMLNPVDGPASRHTPTFFDSRVHMELVRDTRKKALKTPGSPWAEL